MISEMFFLLSRWIWVHPMAIVYASAALFFAFGLTGPRYGASLAVIVLIAARGGLALGAALWLAVMFLRRGKPSFSLGQFVSEYSSWNGRSLLHRAGSTVLFVSFAGMMAAMGALIGAVGAYLVWRAT
jgi:hypothetical protein